MEEKKYTEAGTDIAEVKKLNAESGLSYTEVKALLAQKTDGQTVEEVPFKRVKENVEVDSSIYKLNEVPSSTDLEHNSPS